VRVGLYLQALKFDWNSLDFVEISASGVSISVMTRRGVGDDRRSVAPGPRVSEARASSAGPVGPNSAHGQIKTGKGLFTFKSFLNSKPI
jgi:hypothetical protein